MHTAVLRCPPAPAPTTPVSAPVHAPKPDLYAAVDLHGNNGLYCLINEQDERVFQKRLANDPPTVLAVLEPCRHRLAKGIAVESTFNWYWLVDGLQEKGYTVQLVNTTRVQTCSGLKQTNDQTDAFWLAHLQWLGLLPTGYINPKDQRALLRWQEQLLGPAQDKQVIVDGTLRHAHVKRVSAVNGAGR